MFSLRRIIRRHPLIAIIIISFAALFIITSIMLVLFLARPFTATLAFEDLARDYPKIYSTLKTAFRISDIPLRLITLPIPDKLETYKLTISSQDLERLNANLPSINPDDQLTFLSSQYKDAVPATFEAGDSRHQVKVHYRGDNKNHWAFSKKSWRIKFEDDPFEGFESIDLIIPEDRGYFQELVMNYLAQKLNLPVPQMSLVNLYVNRQRQGTYLMAEHWSQAFLEHRGLAESDNLYGENDLGFVASGNVYHLAKIQKFHQDTSASSNNFAEVELLLDTLNQPSTQDFVTSFERIVDMQNFLNWQAHSVLMFSRSQRKSHNLVFDFNSQTGLLEFIPWNITMVSRDLTTMPVDPDYNPLVTRALADDQLYLRRNQVLWKYVSDDNNLRDLLAFLDQQLHRSWADIAKGSLRRFSLLEMFISTKKFRGQLVTAHNRLKTRLQESKATITITTHPETENYSGTIAYIDIETFGFSPIKLKQLTAEFSATPSAEIRVYKDSDRDGRLGPPDQEIGSLSPPNWRNKKLWAEAGIKLSDFTIAPRRDFDPPESTKHITRLFFTSNQTFFLSDLSAKTENAVTNKNEAIYAVRLVDDETFRYLPYKNMPIEQFLSQSSLPFIRVESSNQITLSPGVYTLSEITIIPSTVTLIIQPGTTFRFGAGASLVAYGQVIAQGSDSSPIVFTSDSTDPWGVFAVVGSQADGSKFSHLLVEHAGQAYINGTYFTGALAIHYADTTVTDSIFRLNTGDDGLNIKHANTKVTDSEFIENSFDGLDLDVITGEVAGNTFTRNGNDGLDISFSDVVIDNNQFTDSGDKCISVGEKSTPKIKNNHISGCNIGIAAKDLSEVSLTNNQIINNTTGVAVYQKKDIFGGAKVTINNNQFENNDTDFDISDNSELIQQ